jgi:multicomponent Na+:H+ antiporter subunit F
MTVALVLVSVVFALAGALALVRIIRGPSILDRMVATDCLLAVVLAAVVAEAAYTRDATSLPVVVVLSVLGFTGSVAVSRFATRGRRRNEPEPPVKGRGDDS